jgi:hypothetical protein
MMEVQIPFLDEFTDALLGGRKTMTCRTKAYGKRGDYFKLCGAMFVIMSVEKINLGYVADKHYKEEGCTSRADFIRIWNKIHRRKRFDPLTTVYVHDFFKVLPTEPNTALVKIKEREKQNG